MERLVLVVLLVKGKKAKPVIPYDVFNQEKERKG